jgi:hypothetical protein
MTLGQESIGLGNVSRIKGKPTNAAAISTNEPIEAVAEKMKKAFGVDSSGDPVAFPLHTPDGFDIAYVGDNPAAFAQGMKELYGDGVRIGNSSGRLIGNANWDEPDWSGGFKPSKYLPNIDKEKLGPTYNKIDREVRVEASNLLASDARLAKAGMGDRDKILTLTREILSKEGFEGVKRAVEAGTLPVIALSMIQE